ncbi:MAG: hypothetical protein LUE99_07335 [Bacteroides sp.]|nr:hypothetical protein [Bacteroides sp.]
MLYLHEQPAKQQGKDTPAPALLLTYTLNGTVNTMRVELKADNGTRLDIRRNNRYTLMVGTEGGASTRVACSIKTDGANPK